MEKFPVPQADRLIGEKELTPEQAGKYFTDSPVDQKGDIITNPKKILTKIFREEASKKINDLELEKVQKDISPRVALILETIAQKGLEQAMTLFN